VASSLISIFCLQGTLPSSHKFIFHELIHGFSSFHMPLEAEYIYIYINNIICDAKSKFLVLEDVEITY
jgi:hypothetical protein